MRVAARFPVTQSPWLLHLIILLHLSFLVLGYLTIGWHWGLVVILVLTIWSFHLCAKHHKAITNAADDLCWSGEHWLMHPEEDSDSVVYLTILPNSWISSFACLLHFEASGRRYFWLFSKQSLGTRAYSELVYLCNLTLSASLKSSS